MMKNRKVVILGIGCTLMADQGFGISVVQALAQKYWLPAGVQIVDGGLIGVGLTGMMAQADDLIVIDVMRNQGAPGDIYRLEGERIAQRLTAKNSVPQVEFLEALAHCQALDHPPATVLLAIEPEDTDTLVCELTPVLHARVGAMIQCILKELDRLGVDYRKKREPMACA